MEKNKELVIFIPSIEGGGVEKNLFLISKYLKKKIKTIHIITYDSKFKKKLQNIKITNPKLKIKNTNNRKIKYFFCLIQLIKLIIKNKNLLIFSFQANIYCAIVCKIFKIRIVARLNSSPSGWSKNIIKEIIFHYFYKNIDKIIVNSAEFQREMRVKFKVKTEMIYNPLNLKEIKKQSKIKFKFKFFDDSLRYLKIINIGRLVSQKNQMMLLKSINDLKKKIKIKALIIGSGKQKNSMQNYINKNNLKNIVKIIVFQKNPYKYINKSDLLVSTSNYEGLPNVLLEAASLKKLIISTDCPTGPKEILSNGKGGILTKVDDFNQLSNKILYIKSHKKECNKKINYAYKNLDRFSYKKNMSRYYTLIHKYLKN